MAIPISKPDFKETHSERGSQEEWEIRRAGKVVNEGVDEEGHFVVECLKTECGPHCQSWEACHSPVGTEGETY